MGRASSFPSVEEETMAFSGRGKAVPEHLRLLTPGLSFALTPAGLWD